jgi:hypothetical protein
MRRTPLVRRFAAAGLSAGLVVTLGLGQAQAATTGWRVTKTLGPYAGATYVNGFVASGARDAWSTWGTCNPCSGSKRVNTFTVQRWNGRSWSRLPLPKALEAEEATFGVGLAASSSTNAWLFNWFQDSTRALHWTGKSWHVVRIPRWVVRGNLSGEVGLAPYAFSPASAWVFSLGIDSLTKPQTFAARYSGGRWTKSYLPGVPTEADAVSASDIWVLGMTAKSAVKSQPVQILMHWNGNRWSTVKLPKRPKVPAGSAANLYGLTADNAHSVWLERNIVAADSAYTMYLLHWNGAKWQRVAIRYGKSSVDALASDGHGGLWMIATGPGETTKWYFDHYRAGRWGRVAVPSAGGTTLQEATQLVNVPGTRIMLVAGGVLLPHRTEGILGAIWQYGG